MSYNEFMSWCWDFKKFHNVLGLLNIIKEKYTSGAEMQHSNRIPVIVAGYSLYALISSFIIDAATRIDLTSGSVFSSVVS